jgi:hypothetical protein
VMWATLVGAVTIDHPSPRYSGERGEFTLPHAIAAVYTSAFSITRFDAVTR